MQIVYVDILWMINVCMDFLSLYFSGRLLHVPCRLPRLLFAALLGGMYAVASVFLSGEGIFGVVITFAVSLVMCYTAFGGRESAGRFGKLLLLFYFVSFLFGGGITALYDCLQELIQRAGVLLSADVDRKTLIFFAVSLFCGVLLRFGMYCFSFSMEQTHCKLRITLPKGTVELRGLADTGNLLKDPFSGKSVILVRRKEMESILPRELRLPKDKLLLSPSCCGTAVAYHLRWIPIHTVQGEGILLGLVPQKTEIIFEKRGKIKQYTADAVIAVDESTEHSYSGYDAIVPYSLIA